jgi:hypothetical protein
MKELMKKINKESERLGLLIKESEFFRNGARFSEGDVDLVLQDGFYVLYKDGDVLTTTQNFIKAFKGYQQLTR